MEDQVFFSPGPQKPLPTLSFSPLLVIISGIDQNSSEDCSLSLELFQQWIFGNLPSTDGAKDYESAAISRVVVAGNSVQGKAVVRAKNVNTQVPESMDVLASLKKVDELLSNLCRSVNVDLMPGEFDPANHLLPQQPMHFCMFPEVLRVMIGNNEHHLMISLIFQTTQHKSFMGVTNPYEFSIEGRHILGTSGQNVRDIVKFADMRPLEALRWTVKWGHIAPTCPDTLASYPFTDTDPFVMETYPHVYFAGNCDTFETELYEDEGVKSRLICVPKFSETQSVVVVDLATLECREVSFKVDALEGEMEE